MNRRGVTHVKPDEAQGHAGSPNFSSEHVASGFRWGINMMAKHANDINSAPGFEFSLGPDSGYWGDGFQKP